MFYQNFLAHLNDSLSKTSSLSSINIKKEKTIYKIILLTFIQAIKINIFTILGIILGAILGAIIRYKINDNLIDIFFAAIGTAFSIGYIGLIIDEIINKFSKKDLG
jgi:uncharacterized membrane protein YfcA